MKLKATLNRRQYLFCISNKTTQTQFKKGGHALNFVILTTNLSFGKGNNFLQSHFSFFATGFYNPFTFLLNTHFSCFHQREQFSCVNRDGQKVV